MFTSPFPFHLFLTFICGVAACSKHASSTEATGCIQCATPTDLNVLEPLADFNGRIGCLFFVVIEVAVCCLGHVNKSD